MNLTKKWQRRKLKKDDASRKLHVDLAERLDKSGNVIEKSGGAKVGKRG